MEEADRKELALKEELIDIVSYKISKISENIEKEDT